MRTDVHIYYNSKQSECCTLREYNELKQRGFVYEKGGKIWFDSENVLEWLDEWREQDEYYRNLYRLNPDYSEVF